MERLFKTLQDRLIREMRLMGIKSEDEANEFFITYLPKYNRKFTKPAASEADLHRPPALHSRELDRILCIKEERIVKNDFTIAHNNALYQIEHATRAKKVTVEERLDGTLHITYNGQDLGFREITKKQTKDTSGAPLLLQEKKQWTPPADHPWKRIFLLKRRKAGTAYRCSLKTGHFYFGLTNGKTYLDFGSTIYYIYEKASQLNYFKLVNVTMYRSASSN